MSMRPSLVCVCALAALPLAAQGEVGAEKAKANPAELTSAGPLAFAQDNLLVADPKAAAIFSFDVADAKGEAIKADFSIEDLAGKIAGLLGTEADQVQIADVMVHPKTRIAFASVMRGRGAAATPALVTVDGAGKLRNLSTEGRAFTVAKLTNAPAAAPANAAGQRGGGAFGGNRGNRGNRGGGRGGSQRMESITDIAFVRGQVVVAGLSNEEFASKLRVIDYPFAKADAGTSIEIYHGAHGRFETRSPVRTFLPYEINGKPHIVAAYTCTPLVLFPLSDLEVGRKVRGRTIAELGNRNRPLDIIAYKKGDEEFLLMSNSTRGVMKIPTTGMGDQEAIEERVAGGGTAGLKYETIESWKGIVQLDKLDDGNALVVQQGADGALTLKAVPLP